MNNSDDRVTLYLAVESLDLTPSIVTDRMRVRPDREWTKGDLRGKTGKYWERHGWILETTVRSQDCDGGPASALIPIAMARFEKRVRSLAEMLSELRSSAEIYVVLGIVAKEAPGIECSPSFLELMVTLGGTFQIDLSI